MSYSDYTALIKPRMKFTVHLYFVTDLYLPSVIYDLSTRSKRFMLISQQAENGCSWLRLQNSPHVFPPNPIQFCQPARWWLVISLDPVANRSSDSAHVLITLGYGQYFLPPPSIPTWPWEVLLSISCLCLSKVTFWKLVTASKVITSHFHFL